MSSEEQELNALFLSWDAKLELAWFLFSRGIYLNSVEAMFDIEQEHVTLSGGEIVSINIKDKESFILT